LAATALAAAGTTAYVVRDTDAPTARMEVATATTATPVTPSTRAAQAKPGFAPTTPPPTTAPPARAGDLPPNAIEVPPPDPEPSIPRAQLEKLGIERGPSRGPANAKVTVVVFTDMRCKFCGAALGSLDQPFDEYPRTLRIVVK